jgi:hypothetical protein
MRLLAIAVGATMALFSITAPASSAPQDAACPLPASTADGNIAFDELTEGMSATGCELVGVEISIAEGPIEATLVIPPPGEGIEMQGFAATDDAELEVLVGVTPSGDLALDQPDETTLSGTLSACEDGANNLMPGGYLEGGEDFHIKIATFPSDIDQADTRQAIEDGIRAWPTQSNDCDMADLVYVATQDGGGTSVGSSVTAIGCDSANNDTTSVFSFGAVPSVLIALTCRHIVYTQSGAYSDGGDVKFSNDVAWTNAPNSASCTDQVDVQSVATHEAGHWWGVAHVRPRAHPKLTMRDGGIGSVQCNGMLRTLGKGDVLSMRHLY